MLGARTRIGLTHMNQSSFPVALVAVEQPPRIKPSNYPEPFASRMAGRIKRPLGVICLAWRTSASTSRFSPPGAVSALRHAHSKQDEFVYVLEGNPSLHTDFGTTPLAPGMCAGFCGEFAKCTHAGEPHLV